MAMEISHKNIILGIGIIISFALFIIFLSMYFNDQHDQRLQEKLSPEQLQLMDKEDIITHLQERQEQSQKFHSYYLLPFAAFIGLLIGLIVYYVMIGKLTLKEQVITKNTKIILDFLSGEERKVITTLLEHNGKVAQYELSHLPGLGKVKTHRILLALEQKGIIHKEKLGKINKIVLNKELQDVLG